MNSKITEQESGHRNQCHPHASILLVVSSILISAILFFLKDLALEESIPFLILLILSLFSIFFSLLLFAKQMKEKEMKIILSLSEHCVKLVFYVFLTVAVGLLLKGNSSIPLTEDQQLAVLFAIIPSLYLLETLTIYLVKQYIKFKEGEGTVIGFLLAYFVAVLIGLFIAFLYIYQKDVFYEYIFLRYLGIDLSFSDFWISVPVFILSIFGWSQHKYNSWIFSPKNISAERDKKLKNKE